MTIAKIKNSVGVAWLHPEEIPWLSRSRRKMPRSRNNDTLKSCVGVAWRLGRMGHGGTLQKYPRHVETENRIYPSHYYCYSCAHSYTRP